MWDPSVLSSADKPMAGRSCAPASESSCAARWCSSWAFPPPEPAPSWPLTAESYGTCTTAATLSMRDARWFSASRPRSSGELNLSTPSHAARMSEPLQIVVLSRSLSEQVWILRDLQAARRVHGPPRAQLWTWWHPRADDGLRHRDVLPRDPAESPRQGGEERGFLQRGQSTRVKLSSRPSANTSHKHITVWYCTWASSRFEARRYSLEPRTSGSSNPVKLL